MSLDPIAQASALALADLRASAAADPMNTPPPESQPTPSAESESTSQVSATPREEGEVTPVPESPAKETTPTATPGTPSQEEPKTWKVVHDGVEVKLTESEAIELARKGFDYTKKTQTLAELRREADEAKASAQAAAKAEMDQERARIGAFLRDPGALRAQLNVLEQAGVFEGMTPAPTDPHMSSPQLTAEDVARMVKEEQAKFAAALQASAEKTVSKLEFDQLQKDYTEKTDNAVKAAVAANPILATLKDPKKVIFADVHPWVRDRILANPDKEVGVDAVIAKINEVAAAYAQSFETTANERAKALAGQTAKKIVDSAVSASQELAQSGGLGGGGSVASGGAPPVKSFKVGDPRLRALVMEDLHRAADAAR